MKLTLLVKPGSRHQNISLQKSLEGDVLIVSVKEPPIDGKANKAVIYLLSKKLNISKSSITIQKGQTSRYKRIEINASDDTIQTFLDTL